MNAAPAARAAGDPLAGALFEVASLDELPVAAVRSAVAEHSLACIRGLFDPAQLRAVLQRMGAAFDPAADRKLDPSDSDAVRRNFQRLQVGANSGVGSLRTLGRFVRAFYNPMFAEDVHGMRAHFATLARLRNLLAGRPVDYAVDGDEDGSWTCARLLQYPRGGGFLVPHRDIFAQTASSDIGQDFFQPVLLLTERGRDFAEGGGYVDRAGGRFLYEPHCRAGDVVLYDGRSMHGVADIDPLADLDLQSLSGRVVALVSIYKRLASGGEDYARLAVRGVTQVGLDE
jgi:hypothetical protein